ncbi:hypothetical protein JD844_008392 [Phrynosoma platyrhinos]|uniref:Myotubularin phosphatase domain-containing protein n=1 Tax=Phrynosoma platyrhinos TaxID=52577 RepID=A0ABQ7TDX5_PHRPL|nr:hypothetical protein JD844_008392 [Phrynosoma platyrhinos]
MGGINYVRRNKAAAALEEEEAAAAAGEEAAESSWEELPTPPSSPGKPPTPASSSSGRCFESMLGAAGGAGAKPAKPSFVSYISPEEVYVRDPIEKEVDPHLLPGELVLCEANMVWKYVQDDGSNHGTYGKLICTNFKISFLGQESALEDELQFKNKIIGESDITLQCVDQLYGGQIVSGIVHQTQTAKLFKRLFLFSYASAAPNDTEVKNGTVMFESIKDWRQELERTKGNLKFKVVSANESYNVSKRMYKTIDKPPFEALKIEDLPSSLPSLSEIQVAYTKFKQLFLIDNSADFWDTDVKWFSLLESTNWLEILRRCLRKAIDVVELLEAQNTNVLLIEENASDLCCVISCLVQIMMDSYCRTKLGFQSLIQKEWITGGHAFLDRCNHLRQSDKEEYGGSLDTQGNKLSYLSVWEWSVQFEPEAQALLNNPLYTEKPKLDKSQRKTTRLKHQRQLSLPLTPTKPPPKRGFFKEETDQLIKNILGKRISRLITSSDELSTNSREFYESWHRKPVDLHGLLLPCLEGPEIKVWAQRYLRWIPEAQLPGGGTVATATKILDVMEEVQGLQKKMDEKHSEVSGEDTEASPFQRNPARLSSLFPFALLQRHSLKPVLPTSSWKDLEGEDDLAKQDDEYVDLGDV